MISDLLATIQSENNQLALESFFMTRHACQVLLKMHKKYTTRFYRFFIFPPSQCKIPFPADNYYRCCFNLSAQSCTVKTIYKSAPILVCHFLWNRLFSMCQTAGMESCWTKFVAKFVSPEFFYFRGNINLMEFFTGIFTHLSSKLCILVALKINSCLHSRLIHTGKV